MLAPQIDNHECSYREEGAFKYHQEEAQGMPGSDSVTKSLVKQIVLIWDDGCVAWNRHTCRFLTRVLGPILIFLSDMSARSSDYHLMRAPCELVESTSTVLPQGYRLAVVESILLSLSVPHELAVLADHILLSCALHMIPRGVLLPLTIGSGLFNDGQRLPLLWSSLRYVMVIEAIMVDAESCLLPIQIIVAFISRVRDPKCSVEPIPVVLTI